MCKRLFIYFVFATLLTASALERQAVKTQANVMVELAFTSAGGYADPFNDVSLDVVFTDPERRQVRMPSFWAGSNVWKVRYASPGLGTHRFRTVCSDTKDTGLEGVTGTVEIERYTGSNPLYVHGPLRISPNGRYLEHQDHTPFFWLADTWWMGLCHRLQWPGEFQALTADRKEKGFNTVQIVAGLYPDMFPFDPRGANEAGYPWETNYTRINPQYFDAADRRLGYLVEQGLMPCIVGAWGYFMPWMGAQKMKAHWRYVIARYGAWPVVWCAAGEANLPWYLAPGFPYDDRQQVHDWTEVMRYIRATDPFHRLLTVHPTAIKRFTARHATDDPALLDFDMLQTPHGQAEAVPVIVNAVRESFSAIPRMPVIDGEASYEMLGDSLPTEWTRRMCWLSLMNGAAGHTYGANGIWQCNRPGQPHGPSPHGGSYGKIPWNEAMHLPGSRQVGLAKSFLEQFPWYQFEPHPEWVSAEAEPLVSLDGCAWIWFPEGNPAKDAPAQKRIFRKVFTLPEGILIARASLRVSADDWCEVRVNGNLVGNCNDWARGKQFNFLDRLLRPGTNVIAIEAENKPTSQPANPAGLLACLKISFAQGESLHFSTDDSWRCATNKSDSWDTGNFDDSHWAKALVVGHYGDGPWGRLGVLNDAASKPQATGIPGQVRVIYVPQRESIEVHALDPQIKYAASFFDPVNGGTDSLGIITADERGNWNCAPPLRQDQDWVLVLKQARAPTRSSPAATAPDLQDLPKPTSRTATNLFGWMVRVDNRLLTQPNQALGCECLQLLEAKLNDIQYVVAIEKLEKLRSVPIVLDLTHGRLRSMQYHPSAGWLQEHGYSTELAKCVHIPRADDFARARQVNEQPWVVLHELAHAYHDQVLGFENVRIDAAYEQFKQSDHGNNVLLFDGSRTRHYGLTDAKEFFAEFTESYFGMNDFFPFNRAELKTAEPDIYALMLEIWGPVQTGGPQLSTP